MPAYRFFLGKGGVGKSTISAITALRLSQEKRTVLLVSLDPAHNLHDIFQIKLGEKPKKLTENLLVAQVDHKKWIERYLANVQSDITNSYRYLTSVNLDKYFDILTYSPGIEEYALLLALEEIIEKNKRKADSIIFDMPPTALALKILRMPGLSLKWLDKLLELRNEIIHKRQLITKIRLGKHEIQTDHVLNSLKNQHARYQQMQDVFENKDVTGIDIVINPDKLSISESDEIITGLKNMNIPVGRLIFNKVRNLVEESELRKKYNKYDSESYYFADYELVDMSNLSKYLMAEND